MKDNSKSYFARMIEPIFAEPGFSSAEWRTAWISAYWSSPMIPLEEWREKICTSNINQTHFLSNVIEHMPTVLLIRCITPEVFKQIWCRIRVFCSQRLFSCRKRFDLFWAVLATGHFRTPPLDAWWGLSQEEKKAVKTCMKLEGRSIDGMRLALADLPGISSDKTLDKLNELGFICFSKDRVWRNDAYMRMQAPRPVTKRKFIVKGELRTFISSAEW